MSAVDEFLRRFAASPMHVPQLERLLALYETPTQDAFAAAVIAWDHDAPHPEAARIALELLIERLQAGTCGLVDCESVGRAILSVPEGAPRVREWLRNRFEAATASADTPSGLEG